MPVIEPSRVGSQVPFSNDCGLITGFLQQFGEGHLAPIEPHPWMIGIETVFMTVFAGEDSGPAWPADRIRDQTSIKAHPFFCQPVDIGCLNQFGSIRTDGLVSVVVGHDEKNVWRTGGRLQDHAQGHRRTCPKKEGGELDSSFHSSFLEIVCFVFPFLPKAMPGRKSFVSLCCHCIQRTPSFFRMSSRKIGFFLCEDSFVTPSICPVFFRKNSESSFCA